MQIANDSEHQRDRFQDLLHEVLSLPVGDQLDFHRELTEVLGGELGAETALDHQARLRAESLEALRAVAKHLGRGPDEPLKAKEFDRACKELGSDWRQGRVIRIWSTWSHAQGALMGGYVPQSAAERAARSAAARGRSTRRGDPIRGVRLWLKTEPKSETLESYKAFRKAYNENLPEGETPLHSEATLVKSMGLRWATIKDIARGKVSLAEALAARSTPTVSTPAGELVGGKAAAEALGREYEAFRQRAVRRDFPPWAARVGTLRLWRLEDIVRYRDGRRDYITEEEGELQGEVLGAADVGRRVGLSRAQVESRVKKEQWDKVPEPAGKLGSKQKWWLRSQVEEWERGRKG